MALRAARTLAPRAAQATARRSMATEKEIAMRIASTKNIRKITSSMKMVSAAKLKGDQNRLAAAKQFAAWTAVLDEPATPLEELEGTAGLADHSVVVAISSDKGLCGGVHSAVARGLRTINARLKEENKTMNVIAVGEKGRSQLRRMVPDSLTTALTNIPPPYNFGYASTVAQMALDTEPEKTGAIAVVYNKFVSAIAYSPTLKTIAPFVLEGDDVTLTAYDADDDVLRGLREYYLATEIFYGMMEGATSEQSSRMQAMENATKNAGELIDKLTLIYNRARQARITTELIEIISGASALE
jgi:F-type H+-transporting ATPase subunit gamma